MSETSRISAPPHTTEFSFEEKHVKKYPHLDAIVALEDANEMDMSPEAIINHGFLPLLRYSITWRRPPEKIRRLVEKDDKNEVVFVERQRPPKNRDISYASHKDALVYKHHREILSPLLETSLLQDGINECVVAYRKIPKTNGKSGNQSNIEISSEVFQKISVLQNCCVVAIDISNYFGSIDHAKLSGELCRLLGVEKLPKHWKRILRNVTKYRYIDLETLFLELGYSIRDSEGKLRFQQRPREIPRQLCTNVRYRRLATETDLIKANTDDNGEYAIRGIPQGTPISDILANLYLREVDQRLKAFAKSKGGFYRRYSDDILIAVPGDGRTARTVQSFASKALSSYDESLRVNSGKTEIAIFKGGLATHTLHHVENSSRKHRNFGDPGISYLGFKFDGANVYLRNSTITNLRRKVVKRTRAEVHSYFSRYSKKRASWLKDNLDTDSLYSNFLQMKLTNERGNSQITNVMEDEAENPSTEPERNFYSYLLRAEKAFPNFETGFRPQIKKIKKLVGRTAHSQLKKLILSR